MLVLEMNFSREFMGVTYDTCVVATDVVAPSTFAQSFFLPQALDALLWRLPYGDRLAQRTTFTDHEAFSFFRHVFSSPELLYFQEMSLSPKVLLLIAFSMPIRGVGRGSGKGAPLPRLITRVQEVLSFFQCRDTVLFLSISIRRSG